MSEGITYRKVPNDIFPSPHCKKIGVEGYLLKDCGSSELTNAIRVVYNGGTYLNTKSRGQLSNMDSLPALSTREFDVLKLIAEENCSRQIAETLNLSIHTIRTVRDRLMIKAGVTKSAGLVYWAMKNNLLK